LGQCISTGFAAKPSFTIAGALIRELERKLPEALREEQREKFILYRRVLVQKPHEGDKIYSLHEPHIYCVAKGKEHKKYEWRFREMSRCQNRFRNWGTIG
jgi:IS5 family transposase